LEGKEGRKEGRKKERLKKREMTRFRPGMMVHIYNPSTQKPEAG
jgi:hypothetical protein